MALSDPQSAVFPTYGTKSLALVSRTGSLTQKGGISAVYMSADGLVQMTVSHQQTGVGNKARIRSVVRIDRTKVATDPLTAENINVTASEYTVTDRPLVGFSAAEIIDSSNALTTWRTTGTNANVTKLYGLES
jgi:hypothetical protein